MQSTDPRQMTGAEFRLAREHLGLTTRWLADHMGVAERTVHRWEAGTSLVPEGVRIEMDLLAIATDREVERAVSRCRAQEQPTLATYRTDRDYLRAEPGQGRPASWHRAVAARVAAKVPHLTVTYWED